MDRRWREWERLLEGDPENQELLVRATMACRRSGRPLPKSLRLRELSAGFSFESDSPLGVWILAPDATPQQVGRTPGAVSLPVHRAWWIQPEPKASPLPTGEELSRYELAGLSLPPGRRDLADWCEQLPRLVRLDLGGSTWLADLDLTALGQLNELSVLSLWHCRRLSAAGLERLSGLSRLQQLDLSHTRVGDAGLERVARLSGLASLRLGHASGITGTGLKHLAQLRSLLGLDLRGCTTIPPTGLEPLRSLPDLTILNLSGCRGLNVSAAEDLAEIPSLRELYLVGCDPDLISLAQTQLAQRNQELRIVA